MCFLASIIITIIALVANVVIYLTAKAGTQVNSIVIIVVCSVIVGIIALPLIGFFIFHLYLVITGRTTREVIKSINVEEQKMQWCSVDPPLIDYFEEVPA